MSQSYQILVVDDEQKLAEMTKLILEEKGGYTASILTENERTLEVLYRDKPQVVILDVMMPKPEGLTLCKQIKQDPGLKDIKVIVFSSKDYDADRKVALKLGADAFLSKLTSVRSLIPTVNSLLAE